jgi:hypothetical protein
MDEFSHEVGTFCGFKCPSTLVEQALVAIILGVFLDDKT